MVRVDRSRPVPTECLKPILIFKIGNPFPSKPIWFGIAVDEWHAKTKFELAGTGDGVIYVSSDIEGETAGANEGLAVALCICVGVFAIMINGEDARSKDEVLIEEVERVRDP